MNAMKLAVAVAALPLMASAQDPVQVDAGHYKVLLENAAVRVLKVDVPAGAKSPMHAHPDALLVPLTDGKARFTLPDGVTEDRELVKETAAYTPASVHAPANVGATRVEAILVEFKPENPGTATLPTARAGLQQSLLVEGPRAVAFKTTAAADFHEPAGSTHEYDQLVIALGAADMTLALEGKAPVKQWQRGDVQFIGRGVAHESKNESGQPVEFIIVAIK
jgi:quercetin dioxygenase-like cupin family protein